MIKNDYHLSFTLVFAVCAICLIVKNVLNEARQ